MKKRLNEAQFQKAIKDLEIGQQTVNIAWGVLVEGRPQAEYATALGLSRGAVWTVRWRGEFKQSQI